MSSLTFFLCLFVVFRSSLATHSFDRLREKYLYPATTYNNSIPFDIDNYLPPEPNPYIKIPPVGHNLQETSVPQVHGNLQPVPHYTRPKSWNEFSGDLWGDMSKIRCISSLRTESKIDCTAAINLIPTGHLIIDPTKQTFRSKDTRKSAIFTAELPHPLRKFRLPAVFHGGECAVFVKHLRVSREMMIMEGRKRTYQKAPSQVEPPRCFNAAAFMYHTVWPNSRRLAELIQENCDGGGGWTETTSSPESNKEFMRLRYHITVARVGELRYIGQEFTRANHYE